MAEVAESAAFNFKFPGAERFGEVTGDIDRMTRSTSSLSNSIRRAVGVFAAFKAISIVRNQLQATSRAAIEFEEELAEIQKIIGEFEGERLAPVFRDLAREIPVARREIAGVVRDTARLGIEGTDNIELFTRTMLELEVATDLTADTATDAFARIITLTDSTAEKIDQLAGTINQLANTMAVSATEIVDSMLRSSAAATQFGLSAPDIAAVNAAMVEASDSARRAGTRMRRLLQVLQEEDTVQSMSEAIGRTARDFRELREESPEQALLEIISRFREGGQAAREMSSVLDTSSQQALAGLALNAEGVFDALRRVSDQQEVANDLTAEFEIKAGTTAGRLELLRNRIQAARTELGNNFLPTQRRVIEGLSGMFEWINRNIFGLTELRAELEQEIGTTGFEDVTEALNDIRQGMRDIVRREGLPREGILPPDVVDIRALEGFDADTLTEFEENVQRDLIEMFRDLPQNAELRQNARDAIVNVLDSLTAEDVVRLGTEGLSTVLDQTIMNQLEIFRRNFDPDDPVQQFMRTFGDAIDRALVGEEITQIEDFLGQQFDTLHKDIDLNEFSVRLGIELRESIVEGMSLEEVRQIIQNSSEQIADMMLNELSISVQNAFQLFDAEQALAEFDFFDLDDPVEDFFGQLPDKLQPLVNMIRGAAGPELQEMNDLILGGADAVDLYEEGFGDLIETFARLVRRAREGTNEIERLNGAIETAQNIQQVTEEFENNQQIIQFIQDEYRDLAEIIGKDFEDFPEIREFNNLVKEMGGDVGAALQEMSDEARTSLLQVLAPAFEKATEEIVQMEESVRSLREQLQDKAGMQQFIQTFEDTNTTEFIEGIARGSNVTADIAGEIVTANPAFRQFQLNFLRTNDAMEAFLQLSPQQRDALRDMGNLFEEASKQSERLLDQFRRHQDINQLTREIVDAGGTLGSWINEIQDTNSELAEFFATSERGQEIIRQLDFALIGTSFSIKDVRRAIKDLPEDMQNDLIDVLSVVEHETETTLADLEKAFRDTGREVSRSFADAAIGELGSVSEAGREIGRVFASSLIEEMTQRFLVSPVFDALFDEGGLLGEGGFVEGILPNFLTGSAQSGGSFPSGSRVLVGERGPEILEFPQRGRVLPNNRLGQSGKSDGSSPKVEVNVINNTDEQVERRSRQQGGKSIEEIIIGTVNRDIERNGRTARTLQNNFGIQRQGR